MYQLRKQHQGSDCNHPKGLRRKTAVGQRRSLALCCAVLIGLMASDPLFATWYGEGGPSGADIVMTDLRWPWWPSGTYYANWNMSFHPQRSISFYGGFTSTLADGPGQKPNPDQKLQNAFRPGSVWSFWGGDASGNPVRFVDVAPNLSFKNEYGGEGCNASLHTERTWDIIQCKRWYTMLLRLWQPTNPRATHSYVGRWIKDVRNNRWHLIGIARLPVRAQTLHKNSGFIECLSHIRVVRPLDRRLGYCRKDGKWHKANAVTINKTRYVVLNVVPEGDHEYIGIEYSGATDLLPQRLTGKPIPGDKFVEVRMKQPDLPTLDKPQVTGVKAECTGAQVAVSWEIPQTSSPALAYRIEVFDNPRCEGTPVAVAHERIPSARRAILSAAVKTPTVRLTVSDVFDQSAPPVTVTARRTGLMPARTSPVRTMPGLSYRLYESPKQASGGRPAWRTLDEINAGRLVRQGLARGLDLSVLEKRTAGYALEYDGLLRVPADGIYIFYGLIDGAYRIQIDGKDVIVRDEQAGTKEHSGFCRLAKGSHVLRITHLYGRLKGRNFRIDWEGPHLPRQAIPVDAMGVVDNGAYPRPAISSESFGDGTGRATLTVDGRGHTVHRSAIYLGRFQIAQARGPKVEYRGPLPKGASNFWCRVIYAGNRSVDVDGGALTVTGKPVSSEWTVRNIGEQRALAGLWQTKPGAFSFFGSGMHAAVRSVEGDFAATCRIDRYSGQNNEPVNRRAWVGIAAIQDTRRINWKWGKSFYLVQTARDGKRSSPDSNDLGGSRVSSHRFPQDHPWVRIARQGDIWTAWTSADGRKWELGCYHVMKAPRKMDVGLFIRAIPQNAQAHYVAGVSELSVQTGVLGECTPPPPAAAKGADGNRLTGVTMSWSNENVAVVRSTSKGLIRTDDGGRTWRVANGNLQGAANAVRSVAIHPTNPAIMLRAAGRVVKGTCNGGLWKTTDAGKTWHNLNFAGDFDGVGPSALCGEVIAFDLRDPRKIYVGTESRGCFRSTDGGATWTCLGVIGERITSVVIWPWEYVNPGAAKGKSHLCVTTCPDKWMSLLGRGTPGLETAAKTAKSYVSKDDIKTLTVGHARADTGYYNVAFDRMKQTPNEMLYGTSYGLQYNRWAGICVFPFSKNLAWMRPFTAVYGARLPGTKSGRCIAQAIDPVQPGRFSVSQSWAFGWKWQDIKGRVPAGGLISVIGEHHLGEKWWFLYTDGLYYSSNGGKAMAKVLDSSGERCVK